MLAVIYPIIGAFYAYFAGAGAHHKGRAGTYFGAAAFFLGAAGVAVYYMVRGGEDGEPLGQHIGLLFTLVGLLPTLAVIFMKKAEPAHA